ncbi:MAG: WGR domain-containing protein [Microscillaceae bacterium]|jgi:poly [ADP-ribose] polymerase|nr:WGR domain-containing protein [Microscillaceae bacterium]
MSENTKPNRTVKLIMVTENNNNKYYEMKESADGQTFTVTYGRVGATATTQTYPIREWDKKYREKVNKGYTDQTHLFAESKDEIKLADINDKEVERLMNDLIRFANKSISNNYNVTADQVTRKQVEEAQRILDDLVTRVQMNMDIHSFNKRLLELYQVIPRRMSHVNDHLAKNSASQQAIDEVEKKLSEEQATLDVMRGQVEVNEKKKEAFEEKTEQINLLEAMGLQMETVEDATTIAMIKKLMQDEASKFRKAYKVINLKSQRAFDQFIAQKESKKIELFWHGSRNENWVSILETSLVLRPANAVITGKMFGYGLYFADKFRKSLNYSSLQGSYWTSGNAQVGYLALFDVHVGRQFHIKHHQSWCYELTEENLKKKGNYDSLYAEGGADLKNNEYIVYNQAQCTIRYLVEVGN